MMARMPMDCKQTSWVNFSSSVLLSRKKQQTSENLTRYWLPLEVQGAFCVSAKVLSPNFTEHSYVFN